MDKRTRRSPKPDDVPRPWTGARIGQTGGNSPSIRHVMPEVIMRLLTAATLLAGVTAGAYAHAPASVQEPIANDSASTATQAPFRMPASEQRNIAENPSWTAPQKPFRIYGNTWHVGPRGLGVFLIIAPTGNVLIDSGVPGDADLIEANIRSLGVDLRDVKWILNSHAHMDHAGDMAKLAHDTGAQVIAGAADVPLLERGGLDDPQYGDRFPFPPVHVARGVADGESLHLGNLVLTAHATPGHTKGNTSWTWTSCEGKRCLHLVDVASLSGPGYKLVGNPKYPDILADFEHSFAVVASLPCDIPLAPHPGMVDFWERVAKRDHGNADALLDPAGCRAYAASARKSFEAELAKQRADAAASK
jgi:metallo-beta-lactamase class B